MPTVSKLSEALELQNTLIKHQTVLHTMGAHEKMPCNVCIKTKSFNRQTKQVETMHISVARLRDIIEKQIQDNKETIKRFL